MKTFPISHSFVMNPIEPLILGTILFLGKAVLMSTLIILLVQYIAQTEVCYLESNLGELPDDIQKMLLDPKAHLLSYRCPYSKKIIKQFNNINFRLI